MSSSIPEICPGFPPDFDRLTTITDPSMPCFEAPATSDPEIFLTFGKITIGIPSRTLIAGPGIGHEEIDFDH